MKTDERRMNEELRVLSAFHLPFICGSSLLASEFSLATLIPMSRKALIVQGGWDGHQPAAVADVFAAALREDNFEVAVADSLDAFITHDLTALALIVPVWTMGKIAGEQLKPVLEAVRHGVGIAGC